MLKLKGKSYRALFNEFDTDNDGLINFTEFSNGMNQILTINQPILETIFNMMDFLKIGMVDYEKFEGFLKIDTP